MRIRSFPVSTLFLLATCSSFAVPAVAQQQQRTPSQSEDVVRVNTTLVQTDVTVFDKQGNFIDGLKRDQFELKVDGKLREISFFERIAAGSRDEEAQLAAARRQSISGSDSRSTRGRPVPFDRGRTVIFFVDDLHLSESSVNATRKLLSQFIDQQMRQNDEAAIASASGQIGFLEQLTDNKAVLLAAVKRLRFRATAARDFGNPPMSEYQALLIERGDTEVLNFFVEILLRENPLLSRGIAESEVRGRASALLQQGASITTNTLGSLRRLIGNGAALPGRKIVFLVSDGFLIDVNNSDSSERIRRITSAASASGVVIYSIDARGLMTGTPDASGEVAFDPTGRLLRSAGGDRTAPQDSLNALAADTGGRAFFNTNALSGAVTTALKESSVYYLLAWRPDNDEQRNPRFHHIEVSVPDRRDAVIRVRKGYGEVGSSDSAAKSKNKSAAPRSTTDQLRSALHALYPKRDLPVSMSLNFIDLAGQGATLTTSLKVSTGGVTLEDQVGQRVAHLELAGLLLDAEGKVFSNFEQRVLIRSKSPDPKAPPPESLIYNQLTVVKPGLYQMRVAVVEEKPGRSGSAMQWIEIPDLGSKALTLSSLIVGERKARPEGEQSAPDSNAPGSETTALLKAVLNVDHRFARSSHLRLLTFVYNAAGVPGSASGGAAHPVTASTDVGLPTENTIATSSPGNSSGGPDLAVQIQVFRDNEPVITDPIHKISVEGIADLSRLPYAAELTLSNLQPGRYVLQVTVIDRIAKTSASQRFNFEVE